MSWLPIWTKINSRPMAAKQYKTIIPAGTEMKIIKIFLRKLYLILLINILIYLELILKDLETINKRIEGLQGDVRQNKKEAVKENEVLKKAKEFLTQEKVLIEQSWTDDEREILNGFQLLTFKPRLFLAYFIN